MGALRDMWRVYERQQILDQLALLPSDLPAAMATDAEVAALASTNLVDSNLIARHKGVWTANTSWLTGDIVQITSAVANGYPLGLWRCTTTHLGGTTFSGTSSGYWVKLAGDLDSVTAAGAYASIPALARNYGMAALSTNPNGLNASSRNVSGTPYTSRSAHWAAFEASALRLVFGNFYWAATGGAPNPNPILIRATIERLSPSGVNTEDQPRIPVLFNGKRAKVLDGQGLAVSDVIPFRVTKGERFYVRTFASSALFGAAPAAPTVVTATTGGAMPTAQTYRVALSYVYPEYETVMGTSTVAPATGAGSTNKLTVTSPAAASGALGYRVWLTANGGGAGAAFYLVSHTIPIGTDFDALFAPVTTAPSQTNQVGFPVGTALLGGATFYGIDNGEGNNSAADLTDTGFGYAISHIGVASSYSPCVVLGQPASGAVPPTPCIIGDSIQAGQGDDGIGGTTRGGAALRALTGIGSTVALTSAFTPPSNALGYIKGGPTPGEQLANYIDTWTSSPRRALTMMASTVISNYGTNDLGGTVAALQANLVKLANLYTSAGIKFIQQTYTPKTTSTDGWKTASNQTVNSDNANRVTMNQWLRSPSGFRAAVANPALVDVFDMCALVEVNAAGALTQDGGFWLPATGSAQATGTTTALSTVSLTDSTKSFTPSGGAVAGLKGYCMRITADASTPAAVGQVMPIAYNTATQVSSLGYVWTTTPSVGASYEIYSPYTVDGVHASSFGYALMSGSVDLSKIV